MAASSLIDRSKTGIPGYDAAKEVEQMGGPVARRASRASADGPLPMSFGRSRCARRDTQEEPPAPDVLSETEGDDEEDEWQYRRHPRASQAAPERNTTRKPVPPHSRRTDDLPRPRRHLHGGVTLLLGALALISLYLVIGWIYSAWVGVSNRLSYGPTPTSYLVAVVGDHDAPGHPSCVVAMNEHGTIVIQVAPGGDFSKAAIYVVPAQTFHAWGNLDDIVVTLTTAGKGPAPNILVTVQGDPDLWHFYQRPSASFLLLNQRPGFKVGSFTD